PPRDFRHYGCRSSRRAQSSGCPSSRGFREVGIFRSLTSDTVRFLTTHRSKRGQPEISRGSIRHRSGRFRRRALVSQRLNATLRRTGTVFDAPGPGFTSAHGPCFANIRDIDTCFTSAHSPCFANTCYSDTCFTSAHSPYCFANTRYIDTCFTSAHRPCFANTCYSDTRFNSAHSPCFANTRYIDTCFTSAHSPCFANTCYIDTRFSSAHSPCFANTRYIYTCFSSAHSPCFANTRYIDTCFSSAHSPCFANTRYIDTCFSSAHSPCFANTCYIDTGFTNARLANNRRPCFANTCFTNDRFTDAWFVNVNDRGFLNAPGLRFTNDRGFLNVPSPRFTNDRGFLNVPSPCFTNAPGFSSAHARRQPISRADSSRCNDLRARPISNCPISIGPGGLIQSSAAHARDTTYESGAIFRGHSFLHFRSQYFFRATRCLVGPQPGRSSFHQLDLQRRFAGVLRPNASVDASATANSNAAISRQRKQSCAPDRANNR